MASTGPITFNSEDTVIHLEYSDLPPIPDPATWTRFVCISDTHGRTFPVPNGDVLLHSGDLSDIGGLDEFEVTMEWLYSLPHKTKILIAGNHDLTLHQQDGWYDKYTANWEDKDDINQIMPLLTGERARKAGIIYVQDECIEFTAKENGRTWSLYGSPWSPEFCQMAFNYRREDGKKLVSTFPRSDIILTHGPPLHIFDATFGGVLAGCRDLANRLPYLRPRIHLFGHIHEGHGAYLHTWKHGDASSPRIQATEEETVMAASGDIPAEADNHQTDEQEYPEPLSLPKSISRTAFVNGANSPNGVRAALFDNASVGGNGFGPIVVDLKD